MKYLPSILAVLTVVATAAAPFVQSWMAQHPVGTALLGAVSVVLSHLLPSPIADKETY